MSMVGMRKPTGKRQKNDKKITFLHILDKNKNECDSYKGNSFSLDFHSKSKICIKIIWKKE
jgi:hypothetical protein